MTGCRARLIFESPSKPSQRVITISRPLLDRARRYLADAAHAFERAPIEVLLALAVAFGCSWAIEAKGMAMREWARYATGAWVALSFAWTGTLLHGLGRASRPQRWLVTAAGLVAGVLLVTLTLDFDHRAENWRALLLVAATGSWLLAVPALAAPPEQRDLMLRRVNGRIIVRALSAALYALALFVGLALALSAIDKLFELGLRNEIYSHVYAWLMLALVPWITLGGLPDYVRPLSEVSAITAGVHRLTRFLIPPLLAVYYTILYAYAVRIAVVGELPKNLVSPMVIAAGLLAAIAVLLFDPERKEGVGATALRLAPPLFLPLAVLGFWSLSPRIEQYGWTEFRFARVALLIALTLLALAGTVRVLRRQRFELIAIPLTLAVVFAATTLGPFSALAVSRRSQQARLKAALTEAELPDRAAAARPDDAGRVVPAATWMRINSSAQHLSTHYGRSALEPILAEEARTDQALANLAGYFGLAQSREGPVDASFAGVLEVETVVPLADGQVAQRIVYPPGRANSPAAMRPDSTGLFFDTSRGALRADLEALLQTPASPEGRFTLQPANAAVPLLDSARVQRGTLIVFSIHGEQKPGRIDISHLDGLLLIEASPARQPR